MTSRSDLSSTWADEVVAETYRNDWGRLLSLLVTRTRRLDLAEDALGEAFARAAAQWPTGGVPDNPNAWLYTTASRLVISQLRSHAIHRRKAHLLAVSENWTSPSVGDNLDGLGDERLALILLCCHPALRAEARSALSLRLVVGTPTDEIARLFLVSRPTMAARITRAKKKIVAAGIPLASPVGEELQARLDDVCRTIYLAFTAGYAPGSGPDLLRLDLAGEAVELAALLRDLVPSAAQVQALYGLLLLQHARRDARAVDGHLATLGDQDRSLWHNDEIQAGTRLIVDLPVGTGYVEELRLQGLLAIEHGRAADASATDWSVIAAIYAQLELLTGSPVVRLNRAVAVAESQGAHAGLDLLTTLDETLGGNHRLHAVRADLARRSGDVSLARSSYLAAIELCNNDVELHYLTRQLNALN